MARQQAEAAQLQIEQNQVNATAYAAQETALGMVTAAKVLRGREGLTRPLGCHPREDRLRICEPRRPPSQVGGRATHRR
jgi:hypothetical protein